MKIMRCFSRALRGATWPLCFSLCLALAACAKAPRFDNLDITGNKQFADNFALPDAGGKIRTLADYKGRAVVLFFGYTHCPDVCPTTLAELSQAVRQLGPDSEKARVLFVTVDPSRDTPKLAQQYASAFNPAFIALRPPDDAAVQELTKNFHIYAAKVPAAASGAASDDYTVDHTAGSYVFDPNGKLRLFAKDGQGAASWVHDLKLLINE